MTRAKWIGSRRRHFWLTALVVFLTTMTLVKCSSGRDSDKFAKKPVPVVLAAAKNRDVPVYLTALGSVTPTYTVTVKTQVNGVLTRVLFKEGQTVKTGELIAEIDSRPYQAQLEQYEGQLARDQALLANAKLDLARYQTLWKQDSVAKQVLDTQVSLVAQYEGAIKLDQGLVDTAKVNLAYCRITSPIDGWIGLRLVDAGNVVQTSDTTGLVVINTVTPITVVFSVAEDYIPQIMQPLKAGKTLSVQAYDRNQKQLLSTGTLLTIDNQIDPTTGTVKLKAQFQNKDGHLFPNQFVNILLQVNTLQHALVVPTAAIQHGAHGTFVYLYNPTKKTVSVKPVVAGVQNGEDTVVTSGVSPGQSVVIQGIDKLTDGSKVILSK